ncbi:hypothetical protein RKE38_10380 [Phycicoccus sp. M110.8]|uniref:hypothetical protein n=1 Tax=Phycicoccus sp. M110.8 TaxID=3075433 RepID=UPI0028FD1BFF|nr:hypothetical protein [Phycicoccus sp. M110.8]MDU0314091.1 hypothetical protein [Phycicoccus sp. M110.8]
MARVDADDDTIQRFVVRHYRYDSDRHERRHVVVDAFDTEAEYLAAIEDVRAGIEVRRAAGEDVDPTEHASGITYAPGDRARAATGHLLRRMVEHGVNPSRYINLEDLPSNITYIEASEPQPAWGSDQVAAELSAAKRERADRPRQRRAPLGPHTQAEILYSQQVKEAARRYNKRVRVVGGVYVVVVAATLLLFGRHLTGTAQRGYAVAVLVGLVAIMVWMGVLLVRQWRWMYRGYRAAKAGNQAPPAP